jgi:xanthine/uracil/vitamin C permease (AzgA family)
VTGIYPLQEGAVMSAPGWPGLLFLAGLVAVLLLHHTKRWGGHAVLIGILLASVGAAMLGLVELPGLAFEAPTLAFALPDVAAALSLRYLDEMLVLLYVVVVDVVATLETIAACSPEMRGADGRLRDFDRGLGMSAVVFLASPFLGMPPMLVLFESLGGVMSGARSWRAAALGATGFGVMIFAAPLAHAIPPFACAVALGYIGYAITQHAVEALPAADDPVEASLGRRLASLAVIVMIVTNSVALTLFGLFVMYPVTIVMARQKLRAGDLAAAVTCAALIGLMFW